jgi:hypothetical protein
MNTRSRRLALLSSALLLLALLALLAASQSSLSGPAGLAPVAASNFVEPPALQPAAAAAPTASAAAAAGYEAGDVAGGPPALYLNRGEAKVPTKSDAPDAMLNSTAPGPAVMSPQNMGQSPNAPTPVPYVGQSSLKAGQVDDNASFNDYLGYLRSYNGSTIHPIDVQRRLFVRVLDPNQQPVAGARVQLFDGDRQVFDGSTVSDGRVLFFPNAAGAAQTSRFRAVITRGQTRYPTRDITIAQQSLRTDTDVVLGAASGAVARQLDNTGPVGIDLVFLVDATGSMGDEIDKIKASVDTIATRIEQLPGSSKPRLGLVAYRDRGDEFVTRSWDFTDNIGQFSGNLAQVVAAGGGDEPESVSAGLHDAIHLQGWADNSHGRHLRMIVLVGDAPPHLDYPNDYEYTSLLSEAAAAGIKIFPIGASGLKDQGEYIFRQFAEVTQGQFVFLTYANGVDGAPGVATSDHVSNYTVKDLDSLVVGLVAGEVANQTGQAIQGTLQGSGTATTTAGTDMVASDAHASPGAGIALTALLVLGTVVGQEWTAGIAAFDQGLNNVVVPAVLTLLALIIWSSRQVRRARVKPLPQQSLPWPETGRIALPGVPSRAIGEQYVEAGWTSGPGLPPAQYATIEQTAVISEAGGQQTIPLRALPPEVALALRKHRKDPRGVIKNARVY